MEEEGGEVEVEVEEGGWRGDERGTRGMSVSLNIQIKDAVHSSLTPRQEPVKRFDSSQEE